MKKIGGDKVSFFFFFLLSFLSFFDLGLEPPKENKNKTKNYLTSRASCPRSRLLRGE